MLSGLLCGAMLFAAAPAVSAEAVTEIPEGCTDDLPENVVLPETVNGLPVQDISMQMHSQTAKVWFH